MARTSPRRKRTTVAGDHLHLVAFSSKTKGRKLHEWASCSLPPDDDTPLRVYAHLGQMDEKGRATWPIHYGPSFSDNAAQTYRLHHSEFDHFKSLRAWVKVVLEGLCGCHQGLQYSHGNHALSCYVAKYVPKFSDSFTEDLLAEDNGTATRLQQVFCPDASRCSQK